MPISVRILNRTGTRPALYASRDFDQPPVSIGRDSTCSVVLDDPNKHISRFHVEIEELDGVYWMAVVSKVNPVMVGGRRYGPGTRLVLKSGDSFEIGEYEVQVSLPEDAAAPATPPPADPTAPPVSDSPLLRVLANAAPAAAAPAPPPAATPTASPTVAEDPALQEATFVPTAAIRAMARAQPGASLAPDAALRAFLEGAGLAFKEMPAAQAERMLRDCGEDLRAHEQALAAGMRAAVIGILRRLNPHALEVAFEKSTSAGLPLPGRKGRLWELFVAHHEKLAHDAQEDINKVLGREFMTAYQSQLRRMKGGL
jgi:predicted component of type VI protein secretion system